MADIIGGLVTSGVNYGFQQDAYRQQKELQGDAQRYNTIMWNKANQYNSAMSQMQRFANAGLNPNLIYSQMNGGLAAPSISAGSAPSPAQAGQMSALETAQLGLINAQKDNIQADTDLKKSEVPVNDSVVRVNEAQIQRFGVQNGLDTAQIKVLDETVNKFQVEMDKMRKEMEKYDAEIGLIAKQTDSTELDVFIKGIEAAYHDQRVIAEIENISSQTGLNNATVKRINTLLMAELGHFNAMTSKLYSDANVNHALKQLYIKEGEKIGMEKNLLEKQGEKLDQDIITWKKTTGDMLGGMDEKSRGGFTGSFIRTGMLFQPFMGLANTVIGAGIMRGGWNIGK